MSTGVNEFCYNYEVKLKKSTQIHRRPILRSMYEFHNEELTTLFPTENISTVEMIMPEDRFRALVEHDHWLRTSGWDKSTDYVSSYRRALQIAKEHEHETKVRNSNPAVQAAYDQYQTLLNLVESNYS
jgi:hypothetical protein